MNLSLYDAVRNSSCTACPLSADAEVVCETGSGPDGAEIMVVTKYVHERKQAAPLLAEVGIDPASVMWCAAIKCSVWDADVGNRELKACKPYLLEEIDHVKPRFILTLGNDALKAVTGHSGIMKYRGQQFDVAGARVFATISPANANRNPGLAPGLSADLNFFRRMLSGETYQKPLTQDRVRRATTKELLKEMIKDVGAADCIAFDIEGTGLYEFAPGAAIVSLAVTTDRGVVWELPLHHPESPWRTQWRTVVSLVGAALCRARKRVAHNGKFDARWLRHFGASGLTLTFDTIVAASLLNENRAKGLKPLAQQILGVDPWGIDTTDLLNTPLDEVLTYNGLDTWYTMKLYERLKADLIAQPELARVFLTISMPMTNELIGVEGAGIWVDQDRLRANWAYAQGQLMAVEKLILDQVPEDLPEQFLKRYKRTGEVKRLVNLNPSNFLRWWLFEHIGMPILGRGKTRDDGSPGAPSVDNLVMQELAEDYPLAALLLERTKWFRMCNSFFAPYANQLDENGRLHTTFKPWGTATGRLSSGKEDAEKLTAKAQTDGVNLQQVPKDPLVRGIFGAPPEG